MVIWFLVIGVALAGCIGGEDDLEGEDEPEIEYRQPLYSWVTLDGDGWFEPGDTLGVSVQEPENAVGNVTYNWYIKEDPFVAWTPGQQAIDTGELLPGESGDLTFTEPAFYEFGHCDPHPWMKHSVAVVEEYDGPDHVTVHILEGDIADQNTWVFEPEHITIGVGTTVTYVNTGDVMHTATVAHDGEHVPVPRSLGLNEQSGTVTLEGSDWMNVLVLIEDEAGNSGWAKDRVYVREKFADYEETSEGSFLTALEDLEDDEVHKHTFEWSGTVSLNITLPNDPTEMLQQIDVELYPLDLDGDRMDPIIAENATGPDVLEASFETAIERDFELVVRPAQGLLIDYEIEVRVVYDDTPPELVMLPCPEPHYSMGHC